MARMRKQVYKVPLDPEKELAIWKRRLQEGLDQGHFDRDSHVGQELERRIGELEPLAEAKRLKREAKKKDD
ncbi:MAG: hypothetical protein J0M34_04495 [Alphaproteobacteria bacterium]|nr:hypothetical protein [Alphaproteobacteria bacterium]